MVKKIDITKGSYKDIIEYLKFKNSSSYEIAKETKYSQGAIWQSLEKLKSIDLVYMDNKNIWFLKRKELNQYLRDLIIELNNSLTDERKNTQVKINKLKSLIVRE